MNILLIMSSKKTLKKLLKKSYIYPRSDKGVRLEKNIFVQTVNVIGINQYILFNTKVLQRSKILDTIEECYIKRGFLFYANH